MCFVATAGFVGRCWQRALVDSGMLQDEYKALFTRVWRRPHQCAGAGARRPRVLGRGRAAPGLPAAPPSPPAAPPPGPTPAPHPRKQGFTNRAQAGLASPRVFTLVPPWDLLDESPGPGNFQTWQHITASLDTREGHYPHHTILYLLNLVKPPHIVRACRSRQRGMWTQHAWRPRSAKVTDTRPHTAAPRGNLHQRLPRTEIPGQRRGSQPTVHVPE